MNLPFYAIDFVYNVYHNNYNGIIERRAKEEKKFISGQSEHEHAQTHTHTFLAVFSWYYYCIEAILIPIERRKSLFSERETNNNNNKNYRNQSNNCSNCS